MELGETDCENDKRTLDQKGNALDTTNDTTNWYTRKMDELDQANGGFKLAEWRSYKVWLNWT